MQTLATALAKAEQRAEATRARLEAEQERRRAGVAAREAEWDRRHLDDYDAQALRQAESEAFRRLQDVVATDPAWSALVDYWTAGRALVMHAEEAQHAANRSATPAAFRSTAATRTPPACSTSCWAASSPTASRTSATSYTAPATPRSPTTADQEDRMALDALDPGPSQQAGR